MTTRDKSRTPRSDITGLLNAYAAGDREAFDELMPRIYDTLREVARRQLWGERKDHTLTPTALVHEAYIELTDLGELRFNDSRHFFAVAARTMRHILVDHAVRRRAQKRGGDRRRVAIEEVTLASDEHIEDLISLNQALQHLADVEERLVRVVECRFFVGLTIPETAEVLGVSAATVTRDWTRARAWLNREITRDASRDQRTIDLDQQADTLARALTGQAPASDVRTSNEHKTDVSREC